ncbi:MAG: cysteine hydrolase family protein [Caldiserica bacterium]|nr:cysteine hydrolase family protein [Caldisericota bacterium]
MRTALLLVDIQREYFPGGAMPLDGPVEAAIQARKLLAHFRYNHLPAVFIQHVSVDPQATSFRPGSPGASLYSSVRPLPGEAVIRKHYPNAFRETNLLELLRTDEVTRLVICGMMTHMCIDATTRAACDGGFECIVAADACATRDLTFAGETVPAAMVQRAFLAALDGTFARVMNADEIVLMLQVPS